MAKKASHLTGTDLFCGAGGSTDGVVAYNNKIGGGVEIILAMNHWKLATETYEHNYPKAKVDCADISACNPRRYVSTDFAIMSPECTNQTNANGKKKPTSQLDIYDQPLIDEAAERSRATMWDVPRFAEYHQYNLLIIENVVEARKWVMWEAWLKSMHLLGYKHKCKYLNSMHFHPTPQSRDRMYVVFWKKGNPEPNLEHTPVAWCEKCNRDVHSVQCWKPNQKTFKYRTGYVYCCAACQSVVEPYYYAAFNCIDWTDLGEPLMGPRKRGDLSPNTIRRCRIGLEKYGNMPFMIKLEHSKSANVRGMDSALFTQTTTDSMHFATPMPMVVEVNRSGTAQQSSRYLSTIPTGYNHHGLFSPPVIIDTTFDVKESRAKSSADELNSQTCQSRNGVMMMPFIISNKGQSTAHSSKKPLTACTTITHHGIVTDEAFNSFVSYYNGTANNTPFFNAAGTFTGNDRAAVCNYKQPTLEDCFYRSFKPHEVKRGMAFDRNHKILGNGKEQVQQLGNAVTPPVMTWLIERGLQTFN